MDFNQRQGSKHMKEHSHENTPLDLQALQDSLEALRSKIMSIKSLLIIISDVDLEEHLVDVTDSYFTVLHSLTQQAEASYTELTEILNPIYLDGDLLCEHNI